jgi:cytochrome P450
MTLATAATVPTTRIDIMSEAVAQDPWPQVHALREQGPVVWHELYKSWFVTTDQSVRDVLSDYRRFTVEGTTMADLFGVDAFISTDDRERHDGLRLIWAEIFRRQGLERLKPTIVRIVEDLLAPLEARVRAGEAVDMIGALCRPLPTLVIAKMMGVPDDRLDDVVRWSDAMAAGGSAYRLDGGQALIKAREAAKTAMAEYLTELIVERRTRPTDDLIGLMTQAPVSRQYTDAQLVQNIRQLLFAGNETTARWLGHIFVTLGERPAVQAELAADRALIAQANDEVMRWQGVVGTMLRKVRGGPVRLAGVELADGDGLTLFTPAATRDPAVFRDPDRFDLHRPATPNLGFGVGLHHCLGINLAKLEAEVAVNAFLDRIPSFGIAGPYVYSSLPLRGPEPVTIAL